jgi:hypothetical protein
MTRPQVIVIMLVLLALFICGAGFSFSGIAAFEVDFETLEENPLADALVLPLNQNELTIVSISVCRIQEDELRISSIAACQLRIAESAIPLSRRLELRLLTTGTIAYDLSSEFEGEDIETSSEALTYIDIDIFPAGGSLSLRCSEAPCNLRFESVNQ